jgi:hypothetical protein
MLTFLLGPPIHSNGCARYASNTWEPLCSRPVAIWDHGVFCVAGFAIPYKVKDGKLATYTCRLWLPAFYSASKTLKQKPHTHVFPSHMVVTVYVCSTTGVPSYYLRPKHVSVAASKISQQCWTARAWRCTCKPTTYNLYRNTPE